nr:MdtA/MuxA family multidrug efflux RND transporter periplasmic adaptor subunit [Pelomonas sp. KK5]
MIAGGVAIWWKTRPASGAPGAPGSAASAAGGAGGAGGGSRRFGGAGPNRTQPVSIDTARQQDIRVSTSAIGTITASNTAVVHAQVSGVLQQIQFKEGQQVKAGQVLAQIDPRAFQAALGQAEGALARDKASLENARVDLARYRDLAAKDAIPKQQLDTQEATLRQLEGTIKVDQAAVDSARLQVSYARVTAPIAGRVGLKQVDLGNVVSPSDANGIVTITQTHPIAMVFAVPSTLLPQITAKLRGNEALRVEAWDRTGANRLAVGRVATLDNSIDTTTDTVKLKAVFPNEDDALFPNQSVGARLQLDVLKDQLSVPSAAVLRGAQGFYVYVVNADNSVSARVVKPGAVDGDWTAIDGKVEAGEKVVIDGVDRLREGAKVEIIAADPSKRAGAATPGGRRGKRPDGAASGAAHGASAPASSASGAGAEDRPRWLDRLPPDVQDKVMKMSPEERQAWIEKRRAERAASGNTGNGN